LHAVKVEPLPEPGDKRVKGRLEPALCRNGGDRDSKVRVQPDLHVRPVLGRAIVDCEDVAIELKRIGRTLGASTCDNDRRK